MPQSNQQKGVITLIFLLVVGFFALGLAMTSGTKTILELKKNINTISADQSFYTAEAAVSEGIYQYINDDEYSGGNFQLINNVLNSSTSVTDVGWPYVEVKGVAENNLTHREVVYTLNVFPEGLAFINAIFSEGNLSLSGNFNVSCENPSGDPCDGNVFSNNNIILSGSSEIEGDTLAVGQINQTGDHVNGEEISGVEYTPYPTLDLQPYEDEANANSTFYDDADLAETVIDGNSITGVVFIHDEDDSISLNEAATNLTGSLVVKNNNLRLNGGTYSATGDYENYAAIVVDGGNLEIMGNVEINGIIYVTGNATVGAGTVTIRGSLISTGGVVDGVGNVNVIFDPEIASNWQYLTGLVKTTTSTPQIIGWEEQ